MGEILLKNGLSDKGFEWLVPEEVQNEQIRKLLNSNVYPFLGRTGDLITPVDKVQKYWNNGDEDDLLSFCKIMLTKY